VKYVSYIYDLIQPFIDIELKYQQGRNGENTSTWLLYTLEML